MMAPVHSRSVTAVTCEPFMSIRSVTGPVVTAGAVSVADMKSVWAVLLIINSRGDGRRDIST